MALWYALDHAAYALGLNIAINAIGGYATVTKAYRAPESEPLCSWVLLAFASLCGIASVGVLDWMYIAYPVYLFGLYSLVVFAVILGRYRHPARLVHTVVDLPIATEGADGPAPETPCSDQLVPKQKAAV